MLDKIETTVGGTTTAAAGSNTISNLFSRIKRETSVGRRTMMTHAIIVIATDALSIWKFCKCEEI